MTKNEDTELMLDVGQADKLKMAFRRGNYSPKDINTLSEKDFAANILPYLRGNAHIVIDIHVIDCDVAPFEPAGLKVDIGGHRTGGQFVWDPLKAVLFLAEGQKKGIKGIELQKLLDSQPVMNANVLDYLLKNPFLIPVEWKSLNVCFWGTRYRNPNGDLYVRYLDWRGKKWDWYPKLLGPEFYDGDPALILKQAV